MDGGPRTRASQDRTLPRLNTRAYSSYCLYQIDCKSGLEIDHNHNNQMDATAPDFVPAMSHSSAPPTLLTATMTCASEDPETTPAFKLCSGRGDTACVCVTSCPCPVQRPV